ncbi:hypothetical protein ACIBXA_31725 [Micromonospora echinaurantiaca]|uniref:hypothetical protein n=1 Tax=Micromonospora echinaurantiaca TaxID=47857 RepID=UPI0037BA8C14
MLSPIQRTAIVHCLRGIDAHAAATHPWPGPVLFAWLREAPVPGHPDPTARAVTVVPLVIDPAHWQHAPDGPLAALRKIAEEAHHPTHQATIALHAGRPYPATALAYLFMHPTTIDDDAGGVTEVRRIDAVDTDGTLYTLTRPREAAEALVTVDDPGDGEVVDLLRRLITLTYPDGNNP